MNPLTLEWIEKAEVRRPAWYPVARCNSRYADAKMRPYRAVAESGGQWCLGSSWARSLCSSTVTPRPGPRGTLR